MKTWKEFCNEERPFVQRDEQGKANAIIITETEYKQIQLDDFKAGERFAANINTGQNASDGEVIKYRQAILTDANNRTTLP